MQIDFTVIETILVSGIGGLGVRALTAQIKKWLGIKGFWVYLVSLGVCAAATAAYLFAAGWNWLAFAIYTAFVFLAANGWYQATKK